MHYRYLFLAVLFVALLAGCRHKSGDNNRNPGSLYLDSIAIEKFVKDHNIPAQRKILHDFYRKRHYAFAWMQSRGLNQQAAHVINLVSIDAKIDTAVQELPAPLVVSPRLDSLFELLSEKRDDIAPGDADAVEFELLMTSVFFDYAKRNWGGVSDTYLQEAEWYIDRKKLNYASLLDSMLSGKMTREPVYRQYNLLKQFLVRYDSLERIEKGTKIFQVKALKKGENSPDVIVLRRRLFLLGDLSANNNSTLFDDKLEQAVKQFQRRHGLEEDGIVAATTLQALNVPVQERVKQILVNMERCRWVPRELTGTYVAVNIPAYRLEAYRDNKPEFSCNVVVGVDTTKTAIFNRTFQTVVINPYWYIPRSILRKETLPAMQANRNYLDVHAMEVTDDNGNIIPVSSVNWNVDEEDFHYNIRQRPGDDNSLGRIKFLFPNSFGIYLHDTPAKSLFGETNRAFSHGCIRVQDARRLAEFLLKDEDVSGETIDEMLETGKEKSIPLKNHVPVFIAYFTAWVDAAGKINFREDIYGHDEKMREMLLE
jgi:murein L,D-transpeptidase YcbB/YkuD